jgi:hypothetical protein
VPIHDVGYRPWNPPAGRLWLRWLVIASAGIRLVWKNHWLRRMLFFAWLPAAAIGFVIFVYEQGFERREMRAVIPIILRTFDQEAGTRIANLVAEDPSAARHRVWSFLLLVFFRQPQAVLMVLLVGLIAPPLISQDVRSRAFLLYFSRPLTPVEYVWGKAVVIWAYLAAVTTVPALVLYVLGVFLSPSLDVLWFTWDIPLRILAASAVLLVPTAALALFFSSLTTESRYAGFAWFAVWGLGWAAYATLTEVSELNRQWELMSLYHVLGRVQAWVFDLHPDSSAVTSAALLLVILTAFPTIVLLVRVTAPLRV